MSKKIEIVTNGVNSFEINRVMDKNQLWKVAQEEGFEGDRTSFLRLVEGKIKSSHGYTIQTQNVVRPNSLSSADKIKLLKDFRFPVHIVDAATETYATIKVNCGRAQINPLNNGMFSVMVLPHKGVSPEDIVKEIGIGKGRSQYAQFGKLTAAEVASLIERLS